MIRARRRLAALIVPVLTAGALTAPGTPALAAATEPPTTCARATLAPMQPQKKGSGTLITRTPHFDGGYTPVLLVHGFISGPGTWSSPTDLSTLPGPVNTDRNLLGNLQALRGAAVYTLDYHDVASKWFTNPGAGGQVFDDAVDCLAEAAAFTGHRIVVVAHSMGGLIARWGVSDAAPGGSQRASKISLVVTLGTPYQGAWLAAVLTALGIGVAVAGAVIAPELELAADIIHQIIVDCAGLQVPGCVDLNYWLTALSTVPQFIPGNPALAHPEGWPAGIKVETLGGQTIIEDLGGLFSNPVHPTVDLGDLVVGTDSATAGDYPQKLATCRFTASLLRAGWDNALGALGLQADVDHRALFLVGLVDGQIDPCFHIDELHTIQLTNEVLGAVADELRAVDEPPYAFLTHNQLEVVAGSQVTAHVTADFGSGSAGLAYTRDGRYAFAVSRPWENDSTIVAVDTDTGQSRRIRCGCATAVATMGGAIAWVQSRNRLMAVDLATGAAPHPITATLPRWSGDTSGEGPYALTGNSDGVLLAYPDQTSAYGGPQRLFLIDPAGHARDLGDTNSNVAIGLAAASAGPGRIALVDSAHGGGCQTYQTVALLDPRAGTQTEPPPNAAIGTGVDDGIDGSAVDDLWWGADGKLYATMRSWLCSTRTDEPIDVVPPSLWRLDDNHWVSIDAGPLLATRQLNPHVKAVVVGDSWYTGGTLYTEVDGHGTQIATGVIAIAAPAPTSAAPGRATLPNGPPACQASLFPSPGPGVKITSVTCHQRYAIAHLTGHINVNGTETDLYVADGTHWRLIAAGATSHGALIGCDIYFAGIDAQRIVDLFPNEDIVGGGAPC